jgi:hypothetical protein
MERDRERLSFPPFSGRFRERLRRRGFKKEL